MRISFFPYMGIAEQIFSFFPPKVSPKRETELDHNFWTIEEETPHTFITYIEITYTYTLKIKVLELT